LVTCTNSFTTLVIGSLSYHRRRQTLAWHFHHLAARRTSDRGQPTTALGLVWRPSAAFCLAHRMKP
jgi:hypothetical protein